MKSKHRPLLMQSYTRLVSVKRSRWMCVATLVCCTACQSNGGQSENGGASSGVGSSQSGAGSGARSPSTSGSGTSGASAGGTNSGGLSGTIAGTAGTIEFAGASSQGGLGAQSGVGGTTGFGGGESKAGAGPGPGPCPFSTAEFFLWSGTAPGSEGVKLTELIQERSTDPAVHDRTITDVTRPSIFPYLAAHPNGAAALIMPGGAYSLLAFDLEGVDIAKWLNSIGVSAFILKYRLPADYPQPWIALADAQRAMRLVHGGASACGIDQARVGVVGFSAGGHLASQLETRPTAVTYQAVDPIDQLDARPAFGVLMYPVISMNPSIAHTGSRNNLLGSAPSAADVALYSSEKQVTASTSPTFIGVSKKDTGVKPENSVDFDNALRAANVAEELHLYNDGAHGTGIRKAVGDMANWPEQAAAWLAQMKFVSGAQ